MNMEKNEKDESEVQKDRKWKREMRNEGERGTETLNNSCKKAQPYFAP